MLANRLAIRLLAVFILFNAARTLPAQTQVQIAAPRPANDSTAPPAGFLTLTSRPDGADIYLDGTIVGRAPISALKTRVGRHLLAVMKDGYCDFFDSINVVSGSEISKSVQLDSACGFEVKTIPEDAAVYVRDVYVGKSPLVINVRKAGWATIKISKRDFVLYQRNILLEPGKTSDVMAELVPRFGTFTLDSYDENISASLDGKPCQTESLHDMMVLAGTHQLVVRRLAEGDSLSDEFFLNVGDQCRWGVRFDQYTLKWTIISALVPGSGQILDGSFLKGAGILAGFLASTALAITSSNDYRNKVNDFNNAFNAYSHLTDEQAAQQAEQMLKDKHAALKLPYNLQFVGVLVAAAVYVYSLVDALIFHTRENRLFQLSNGQSDVLLPSVAISTGTVRCGLSISF